MKRWLMLFLFCLFAYDVALDSFDADCAGLAGDQACHACVCQNHAVDPDQVVSQEIVSSDQHIVPTEPLFLERLFDKSFFHPPKTVA